MSGNPATAMLVLFARTTWARLIASHLGQVAHRFTAGRLPGILAFGLPTLFTVFVMGVLHTGGTLFSLLAQPCFFLLRTFLAHLHIGQVTDGVMLDGIQQVSEQLKRLALVFLLWVFLCIRSEEHTSELQSRPHLVCRLLLEKKKKE